MIDTVMLTCKRMCSSRRCEGFMYYKNRSWFRNEFQIGIDRQWQWIIVGLWEKHFHIRWDNHFKTGVRIPISHKAKKNTWGALARSFHKCSKLAWLFPSADFFEADLSSHIKLILKASHNDFCTSRIKNTSFSICCAVP